MTWLRFILTITGAYLLYYLANICFDLYLFRGTDEEEAWTEELTFTETVQPIALYADGPPQTATGGVSLKELFDLSRKDAIIYTRAVSY
jgi:hypothetical protein